MRPCCDCESVCLSLGLPFMWPVQDLKLFFSLRHNTAEEITTRCVFFCVFTCERVGVFLFARPNVFFGRHFFFSKIAIHWQLGADGVGYGPSVSMTQLSWGHFAAFLSFENHLINLKVLQLEKRAARPPQRLFMPLILWMQYLRNILSRFHQKLRSNVHRIWPSVFNIKSHRDLTKHTFLKSQLGNVTEFQTRLIGKNDVIPFCIQKVIFTVTS